VVVQSAKSRLKEHWERVHQGRSWNKVRKEIGVKERKCTRQESKVRGITVKEDLQKKGQGRVRKVFGKRWF
jgi:hypothetical protein